MRSYIKEPECTLSRINYSLEGENYPGDVPPVGPMWIDFLLSARYAWVCPFRFADSSSFRSLERSLVDSQECRVDLLADDYFLRTLEFH